MGRSQGRSTGTSPLCNIRKSQSSAAVLLPYKRACAGPKAAPALQGSTRPCWVQGPAARLLHTRHSEKLKLFPAADGQQGRRAPPRRCVLRLPGDADAAGRRIRPPACKESPLFFQCTVTAREYSSLLTRVIRLKTKISSDCHKEQQFSALPLFGDAVCVVFHMLFPFFGCGVVIRERGASIMCAGNLPRCRCLAVAREGGGEAVETCCEHPASHHRRGKSSQAEGTSREAMPRRRGLRC